MQVLDSRLQNDPIRVSLIDFQAFSDGCVGDWGGGDYRDLMSGLEHALEGGFVCAALDFDCKMPPLNPHLSVIPNRSCVVWVVCRRE